MCISTLCDSETHTHTHTIRATITMTSSVHARTESHVAPRLQPTSHAPAGHHVKHMDAVVHSGDQPRAVGRKAKRKNNVLVGVERANGRAAGRVAQARVAAVISDDKANGLAWEPAHAPHPEWLLKRTELRAAAHRPDADSAIG